METANIEGQAKKVQAFDSGLACGFLLITDRKREQELGKRLSERRHYKTDGDTDKKRTAAQKFARMGENCWPTLIRRLRHVKQPVLVLRLISFLCRPPDMILPSGGGGKG